MYDSAPDGSSPRVYGRLFIIGHRLKSFSYRLHFLLLFLQAVMDALSDYGRRLVLAEAEVDKLRHELESSRGISLSFGCVE